MQTAGLYLFQILGNLKFYNFTGTVTLDPNNPYIFYIINGQLISVQHRFEEMPFILWGTFLFQMDMDIYIEANHLLKSRYRLKKMLLLKEFDMYFEMKHLQPPTYLGYTHITLKASIKEDLEDEIILALQGEENYLINLQNVLGKIAALEYYYRQSFKGIFLISYQPILKNIQKSILSKLITYIKDKYQQDLPSEIISPPAKTVSVLALRREVAQGIFVLNDMITFYYKQLEKIFSGETVYLILKVIIEEIMLEYYLLASYTNVLEKTLQLCYAERQQQTSII